MQRFFASTSSPKTCINPCKKFLSFNTHILSTKGTSFKFRNVQNHSKRFYAAEQLKYLSPEVVKKLSFMRNIGISAHIDSGKTTLTERILFYTGKINKIHEVKGKDIEGATMDFMELEKEKGITIQSAATYCNWGNTNVNIIDTPGHVDFTIEVERALRVLDGAILVLCAASGVQSQSYTVDRQMKRYGVPRLCFINKLDRLGANPDRVIEQLREKLNLNAAQVQISMGYEDHIDGIIDIVEQKAYEFQGANGENMVEIAIPKRFLEDVKKKRTELFEILGEVDDAMMEKILNEEEITVKDVKDAIRRQCIANSFTPVFMGSAKRNIGVQLLLNGVVDYLPSPAEVDNYALDRNNDEAKLLTVSDPEKPFVGLAFKLEEGQYGQLTYMRVYQGTLKKGDTIHNTRDQKKVKVHRLLRIHAKQSEEIEEIGPGEICALFGIECSSGDSFTHSIKTFNVGMESIFVPDPVVSLSISPTSKAKEAAFGKALNKFMREDPTFKVHTDSESGQTIISGMGELHLEIYTERMKREFDCPVVTGKPYVAYRETITRKVPFDYLHKKQSGGAGQYARVIGYMEPLELDSSLKFEFENAVIGNAISPNFIAACEKGFKECMDKGHLIQHPVWNVRVVLTDGATHVVDSSEMAFRIASLYAFKDAFLRAEPTLLEPIMKMEVVSPSEFQSGIASSINKRRGMIVFSETGYQSVRIEAEVPLGEMFGYMTELRSLTQGKGEFSMEYLTHRFCPPDVQERVIREAKQTQETKSKIDNDEMTEHSGGKKKKK